VPTFETLAPISVTVEFDVGSAHISAGTRTDTVVEVLPSDGNHDADVRAAQQTTVTCLGGVLLVKGPKKRSLFGRPGSIDIHIELPEGSDVHGTAPVGTFVCEGRLGDCRLKASVGDLRVDRAATVSLKTEHGDVRVERVTGDADVACAGRVDIGAVAGTATIKNANGDTAIEEVVGELRAKASNGRITVGVAHAGVEANSAYGDIRVGEVSHGRIALQTAAGDVEIGIREATAAWLDVRTGLGNLRNALTPSSGPDASADTVEVRARTALGDIIVRRP
jgi:hypothetical protein